MALEILQTLNGEEVDTHLYQLIFPIDGVDYRLDLRYNDRMGRWVLDISTQTGETVVTGAPVLLNVNLFSYAVPALRPRGTLGCTWKGFADSGPEPTELTLGAGNFILYVERIEDFDTSGPQEPPKL